VITRASPHRPPALVRRFGQNRFGEGTDGLHAAGKADVLGASQQPQISLDDDASKPGYAKATRLPNCMWKISAGPLPGPARNTIIGQRGNCIAPAPMKGFHALKVRPKAHQLTPAVYHIRAGFPRKEDAENAEENRKIL
jgi:hypothetical protein